MSRQATSSTLPGDWPALPPIPRLEPGDHLDQPTFHARYEAMPESFRAELIEGIVIVPSPLSTEYGRYHALVTLWLAYYEAKTPGVLTLDNAITILGPYSEPQPDSALIIDPECGGQARYEGKYLAGAPELIVEVATSSAAYDLHSKRRDYETNGVLEYIVVLPDERRVVGFARQEQSFRPVGIELILKSAAFPGLWLDVEALLGQQTAKLLETLEHGIAGLEHQSFVARLHANRPHA